MDTVSFQKKGLMATGQRGPEGAMLACIQRRFLIYHVYKSLLMRWSRVRRTKRFSGPRPRLRRCPIFRTPYHPTTTNQRQFLFKLRRRACRHTMSTYIYAGDARASRPACMDGGHQQTRRLRSIQSARWKYSVTTINWVFRDDIYALVWQMLPLHGY